MGPHPGPGPLNAFLPQSLIDVDGFTPLVAVADKIAEEVSKGDTVRASRAFFREMEPLVERETNRVNFYNILAPPDDDFGQRENHIHRERLCTGVSQGRVRGPRHGVWVAGVQFVF